ncbi:MAG: family 43 glycosylhydrolase [Streptomyces sp.]|nr:family 43 glycosylhydrolase [Streptomyces sp.]
MTTTAHGPWSADLGDGTYQNPVLNADWSDPDAIRVGEDFFLTASSFHRVPGLPVLHSTDLVNWRILTHALPRPEPREAYARPRWGCGVWAPAIRCHGGLFHIFYPDPDHGIFVVTAADASGPWSLPRLLKPGRGLIDPCPLWADDGRAYLVHAWARSRSGISNRLTMHRMSPEADRLLDEGTTVVDGDAIPGCTTLEGPKLYQHGGYYWIFAPAGGVTEGWQTALRARDPFGPYEYRIVLEQGDTPVNGPHQGAWVTTASGEDWFLHFSDRGAHGRVVHLQPMRWRADGWPVMGADRQSTGRGTPVLVHRKPDASASGAHAPDCSDDFHGSRLGAQWFWQGNPSPQWWSLPAPGALRLSCHQDGTSDLRLIPHVLGQRLPGAAFRMTTSVDLRSAAVGARAGIAVIGRSYAWLGVERRPEGLVLVHRVADPDGEERDAAPPRPVPEGRLALALDVGPDAVARFCAPPDGPLEPFRATPGTWVGASISLFATAPAERPSPAGHADFGPVVFEG